MFSPKKPLSYKVNIFLEKLLTI